MKLLNRTNTGFLGRIKGLILFLFLILLADFVQSQNYTFSYTYQNISRKDGGGAVEPGDTIEIRALMLLEKNATRVHYRDTIKPGFQLVPNSMKIVTNEGILFAGTYTNASGDDRGMVKAVTVGGVNTEELRINIGTSAANVSTSNFNTASAGGSINKGDKPKFYNNTLIVVAYQLKITANIGDTLYPTGTFYYRENSSSKSHHFEYPGIKVLENEGMCLNFSSASFTAESDFGSGTLQNRTLGVTSPGYVKEDMGALNPNHPGDGEYSVTNNISEDQSIDNTIPYGSGAAGKRIFNLWDIIGDHTNAVDPDLGNPPPGPGEEGGYMLVVNAAYATGEAYSDIIYGLCPNTYYEFSAWIRNICGYCGIDADAKSTNLPGVLPNLAFTINDIDHYTTGEIQWTEKWVKRGFLYKTGPTETSFKITIKNNAAGGGGNDWVLDDIKLATCYPDLIMNPSDQVEVCDGGILNIKDTVRSYFNNYNYYCWEKSTDDGATWTSTGNCGTKLPVLKNGMWEYVIDTSFTAMAVDSGAYLRVKVATSPANIGDDDCSVQNSQKLLLKIGNFDCNVVKSQLKDFNATKQNNYGIINWTSLNESDLKNYELQKSHDGITFKTIEYITPRYPKGGNYSYSDNESLDQTVYYRIKLNTSENNVYSFSKIAPVYLKKQMISITAANPFRDKISMDINSSIEGQLDVFLYDAYGRKVESQIFNLRNGVKKISIDNLGHLKKGVYILKAHIKNTVIQKKLIKE